MLDWSKKKCSREKSRKRRFKLKWGYEGHGGVENGSESAKAELQL